MNDLRITIIPSIESKLFRQHLPDISFKGSFIIALQKN